jgi:hypothetical protein
VERRIQNETRGDVTSRPRTRQGKGRAERGEGGGVVESQGKAEGKGLGGRSDKSNKEQRNVWRGTSRETSEKKGSSQRTKKKKRKKCTRCSVAPRIRGAEVRGVVKNPTPSRL